MNYKAVAADSKASQDKFELWQLIELLSSDPPQRILEIGVHCGGMLQSLLKAFPGAKAVGIDTDFSYLEFEGFTPIKGDSNDELTRDVASQCFHGEPIDFLFIDGDHHYDATMRDFELYKPLIKSGGIIAFHDIMRDPARVPHHEGVEARRVFDELKKQYPSLEIWNGAVGDNAPGIGVIFI